jgi:small subunit ribosomal protein S4e
LAKKGGDTTVKRQLAPSFWKIGRKEGRFVVRARPGPHPKRLCYPLGILLRDVLKLGNNMEEVRSMVNEGKIAVDGVVRRSIGWSVGLMDVIELIPLSKAYRLVPKDKALLVPVPLAIKSEKGLKLVRVMGKQTVKRQRMQYRFHDGKTLVTDEQYSVGDSCLIDIQGNEVKSHMKLQKGSHVLVTKGENAGSIGTIEDIREGLFSLPKRTVVTFGNKSVELPFHMVMLVGAEKPVIQVN